jgi:hypothetical protein
VGKNTLRNCTATQNAVCSKECAVGYQVDSVTEMCEPMTIPITSKPFQPSNSQPVQSSTSRTPNTTDSQINHPIVETATQMTKTPDSKNQTKAEINVKVIKEDSKGLKIGLGSVSSVLLFCLIIFVFIYKKKIWIVIERRLAWKKKKIPDVETPISKYKANRDIIQGLTMTALFKMRSLCSRKKGTK